MKVEQAKQIASKAIEQLSQALERGHSETLREYLAAMARFHRYSLHNIMLIASQRPDATHVAGFQTWKQLGRYVKKGRKRNFDSRAGAATQGRRGIRPRGRHRKTSAALPRGLRVRRG